MGEMNFCLPAKNSYWEVSKRLKIERNFNKLSEYNKLEPIFMSRLEESKENSGGEINDLLRGQENPFLRHYVNPNLIGMLSSVIQSKLEEIGDAKILEDISKIWKQGDYRLLADYLHSLTENEPTQRQTIMDSLVNSSSEFNVNIARYRRQYSIEEAEQNETLITFVQSIQELFDEDNTDSIRIFLHDPSFNSDLTTLANEVGGDLTAFIESHYDLEGINSLVRKGLVRKMVLPNGSKVIAKRNNPEKKGRFQNEQLNISGMIERLGLKSLNDTIDLDQGLYKKKIRLKMLRPFAVLANSKNGVYYSLSSHVPGKTLEEVLQGASAQERVHYLADARKILELLYEKGIWWGDMAPRNIIVIENEHEIEYCILDFEKSILHDDAIDFEGRKEHCRGPMCVEEFGAVCTREEVTECFEPYFNPEDWDIESNMDVPFKNPKRELMAIFKAQGKAAPTLGEYNALEREVMGARFPFEDSDAMHYPLEVSFKVDHYLGADYDRKVTEIFMFANKIQNLATTVRLLKKLLEFVDNKYVIQDFEDLIDGRITSSDKNCDELGLLKDNIDSLYECIDDEPFFLSRCNHIGTIVKSCHLREVYSHERDGINLSKETYEMAEGEIVATIQYIRERIGEKCYVALSGGAVRGELTYGSDLDVMLFVREFMNPEAIEELKLTLAKEVKERFGFEIGWYPSLICNDLSAQIPRLPNLYSDFSDTKIYSEESIRALLEHFLKDNDFMCKAFTYINLQRTYEAEHSHNIEAGKRIKILLRDINFILTLIKTGMGGLEEEELEELLGHKSELLFWKNELALFKNTEPNSFEDILESAGVLIQHLFVRLKGNITIKETEIRLDTGNIGEFGKMDSVEMTTKIANVDSTDLLSQIYHSYSLAVG